MGVRLCFRVLSILGLVTAAATVLAVACGGDDGSGPGACTGADCDGGALSETSTPDGSKPDTDAGTPPKDGETDGDADSSVATSCGDGGAPGTLDESFGVGGMVWLKYPSADGRAIVVQPDGKILVGGSTQGSSGFFALARLLANGTLDATFGTAGLVETKAANLNPSIQALALQADGRIVGAGFTRFSGQTTDFAVLRYLPAGGMDPSFGDGGVVLTDFGAQLSAYGSSVAIQADGRIVVGGYTDQNASPDGDYAIVRYNVNGTLDATFGTGGIVKIDVRGPADDQGLVALGALGKIVVGGASGDPLATTRSDMSVARVGSDGVLDPSFGVAGKFVSSFAGTGSTRAYGVALDSSGRLLLGGEFVGGAAADFAVARLTPGGAADGTWGDGGLITTDFAGRSDVAASVLAQPDGKVVAAGSSIVGGATSTIAIAVARYSSVGVLDTSFGTAGTTLTVPMPDTHLGTSAASLDGCHLLVVGRWGYNLSAQPESAIGIARYWR